VNTNGRGRRLVAVNHTGLVSGAERVLLRVLEGAQARGWSASAMVPDGPLVAELSSIGVASERIPDLMLPGGHPGVAASRLAARTVMAAQRIRSRADGADVIVAAGVRALPALRLANSAVPVVWLAQGVLDRPRWRRLVAACSARIDLAVAVSQAVADSISAHRFPVTVVWNGTPWPVSPAPARLPPPPVVGCAALLTSWKGQNVLLDAVAQLDRQDVIVELVGGSFPKDGTYVADLRRRAAQPDLAGRVRFRGHVDDTLAHMRSWTVATVPSVDPEAGPLSALEAMSVGVPVVATNHGGPKEVIGDAGLLVAPGDSAALAQALSALLDDADLHDRCRLAGPRRIASGFTLDGQIAALLDAVEGTVRGAA